MKTGTLLLYPPEHFSELGMRANNEDALYPQNPTAEDRLFMVCDGVGGQQKGEVAAALTCRFMADHINHEKEKPAGEFFQSALRDVEGRLTDHIKEHPEGAGMATTLTLLYFTEGYGNAHIVWVGDSRVYHIRDGNVLFQTKDHSEVQSLVDMGEITPEAAKDHPRRNIITRAITGSSDPARIDHEQILDIRSGDFFMLCSDGILENLNEGKIKKWFAHENDALLVKKKMLADCQGRTRDNHTAIIIKTKVP